MSDVASAIQFFDFLMQGSLNPITSQYQVKLQLKVKKDFKIESKFEEPRSMMIIPYLIHPGLQNVQYKSFFHMCRLESISFDMEFKQGSTFIMPDYLQSGVIGIMTINSTHEKCFKLMSDALQFLLNQAGPTPPISQAIEKSDILTFGEIYSRFKLLVKIKDQKDQSAKSQLNHEGEQTKQAT